MLERRQRVALAFEPDDQGDSEEVLDYLIAGLES
jgi:hypothetical protein